LFYQGDDFMFMAFMQRVGVGALIGSIVGSLVPMAWLMVRLALAKMHLIPPVPGDMFDFAPIAQSFTTATYGTAIGALVGAIWPRLTARRSAKAR